MRKTFIAFIPRPWLSVLYKKLQSNVQSISSSYHSYLLLCILPLQIKVHIKQGGVFS